MRRGLSGIALAAAFVGAGLWIISSGEAAVADVPQELRGLLGAHSLVLGELTAADRDQIAAQGVDRGAAVDLAMREEPTAESATPYMGKLTDLVARDARGNRILADRLVYAVLLEGVEIQLHGPRTDDDGSPPRIVTTRFVYFVDALTGVGLLGTTV